MVKRTNKRYAKLIRHAILLFFIILLFNGCNNKEQTVGEAALTENTYITKLDKTDIRLRILDEIDEHLEAADNLVSEETTGQIDLNYSVDETEAYYYSHNNVQGYNAELESDNAVSGKQPVSEKNQETIKADKLETEKQSEPYVPSKSERQPEPARQDEDGSSQKADQPESVEVTDVAADNMLTDSIEVFLNSLSVPQEGLLIEDAEAVTVYYYRQTDSRWSKLYYGGTDTIGKYACGPTAMSIVISTLTDRIIDPVQMSKWACDNGYWYPQSGSLHSLIPDAAVSFGLNVTGVSNDSLASGKIKNALSDGKLVVALMGKGHFTKGGHFIILRGIDAEGKILVADPASADRTKETWDLALIVEEARTWAAADGPFWIISN